MRPTVLLTEGIYPDDVVERGIFGDGIEFVRHPADSLAEVPDQLCAAAEGLMLFRSFLPADQFTRFPRLRAVVRMGVGYDRIDRAAAAARGVMVCNCPDYGTTEVADHAIALALAMRRGLLLHHAAQRTPTPLWAPIEHKLIRRFSSLRFGVLGLGRIGTAVALRAKALGFHVVFHDPYRPSGTELALGLERAGSLDELLAQSDTLSLHAPLTPETRGLIGEAALARLPPDAVLVNTARGAIVDLDALEAALRSGRLAGAALDVVPQEPPVDTPSLLRAYRERAPWLEGRLIVTPHSAYWTPEAAADIRSKSAETMREALLGRPRNVIGPEDF